MKKIKLLIVLSLLYALGNVAYVTHTLATRNWFAIDPIYRGVGLLILKDIVKGFISLPILLLIIISLIRFLKNGYFNTGSAKALQWAGILLIVFTALNPIIDYLMPQGEIALLIILSFGSNILPLCIGIGLIVIAEFVQKGNKLKRENQLTI